VGIVVGIMVLMMIVSLFVGLRTVRWRRGHDPKEPLGYLPADTNVVAGLHVGKLLKDRTGQDLLMRVRLGPTGADLPTLTEEIGLSLDQINVAVLGLKVDARLVPRLTLVVQTNAPLDQGKLRAGLKDNQLLERNGKNLCKFRLDRFPFGATLWCADEYTLVFGLDPEDLDAVPLSPDTGVEQLSQPVRTLLQDPYGQNAQAWIVGHADHWDQTVVGTLLEPMLQKKLQDWHQVHSVGVWLRLEQDMIALTAACQCTDEAAAHALQQALVREGIEDPDQVQVGNDGWVRVQSQVRPGAVRQALKGP
jgi:hypothetical protein